MKLLLSLIIIVAALQLPAQRFRNCDCGNKQDTVKQYYETVFRAEQFAMDGNPDSALFYFTNARMMIPMMQNDKANISLLFGSPISDNFKLHYYLNSYKILPDSVTKDVYIKRLSNYISPELLAKLDAQLDGCVKIVQHNNPYDSIISRKIVQMGYDDQHDGPIWEDGKFKNGKAQRRKLDRERFFAILDFYKKYGPINFAIFNGYEPGDFEIILAHNFYDTKLQKKYNPFFENEVRCGNIDARLYSSDVDNYLFDSTQVYGCHTIFSVGDTLIVYQLSEAGKQHFDVNRKRIFLQDTKTTQQKLIWQWQHDNEFIFVPMWDMGTSSDFPTARSIADAYMKAMGLLVTGYRFYTR